MKSKVFTRFKPLWIFYFIGISISLLTRLGLFLLSFSQLDLNVKNVLGIFSIGLFYDICFLSFVSIPIILYLWLSNDCMYKKPWIYLILGLLGAFFIWSVFKNPVPKEYDKKLPYIFLGIVAFIWLRFAVFMKLSIFQRQKWRRFFFNSFFFLLLFLLVLNVVSEFTFWQEFSSRYNFIAVDYLIYTNEVLGNIKESYPVLWIIFGVLAVTVFIFIFFYRYTKESLKVTVTFINKTMMAVPFLLLPILVYLFVNNGFKQFSQNEYVNELAGNGPYEFGAAFFNNTLDFYRFYKTIPDDVALAEVRKQILQRSPTDSFLYKDQLSIERNIKYEGDERKLNVVLISIESFSASFMNAFGNTQNITPFLDSIATQSLFFTNCYATGTRTVRGLEVLSLSIPPIPGQSIVRMPNNDSLFSIGFVLKQKGYTTQFLYGGYSSFDNMGPYFSGNGYEVIDRSALKADEINYANIWGVADEDMFTHAIKVFDKNYENKKPFFGHIMTVSNHRPFTYPEGRINISPKEQRREGAVKYTDYSIHQFIKQAASKPWFKNTIFVMIADHCASAAGKQTLPVTGYHIPLIIYSPAHIQPQVVSQMVSQMDVAPTILGLLNMSYISKFFGQDIMRMPKGMDRVFISTYSNLGFLRGRNLVVQSPPKRVQQWQPDFVTGSATSVSLNDSLYKQAVSYYQIAEKLFKTNGYKDKLRREK